VTIRKRVLQRYNLLHRPQMAAPDVEEFFLKLISKQATVMGRPSRVTHLLRHTYCTRSSELGIPTLTLQRFIGHSQPK
jgi:integrase